MDCIVTFNIRERRVNVKPKLQNKDQVIYLLRNQVRELQSKIAILEKNVRDEVELSHSLMKRIADHKDHEAPKI